MLKYTLPIPTTIINTENERRAREELEIEEFRKKTEATKRAILEGALNALTRSAKALTRSEILELIGVLYCTPENGWQKLTHEEILKGERGISVSIQEGHLSRVDSGLVSFPLKRVAHGLEIVVDLRYSEEGEITLNYRRGDTQRLDLTKEANRDEACRLIAIYAEARVEELERQRAEEEKEKERLAQKERLAHIEADNQRELERDREEEAKKEADRIARNAKRREARKAKRS
jgi:hypothetical protein